MKQYILTMNTDFGNTFEEEFDAATDSEAIVFGIKCIEKLYNERRVGFTFDITTRPEINTRYTLIDGRRYH